MKGWMKKLGAACLATALSACTLTSCTPYYSDYELELVSKPTMTVRGFDEETGMHTILVEGWAYNNSGIVLEDVYANILLYDEFGDRIDHGGSHSIEGMDVEEVWHYYALIETEILPTDIEVEAYGYDW